MKKILLAGSLILVFAFLALAQNKSIYTGTTDKDCKATKESSDEGYIGICKGTGGYRLELLEGDLRQTINVIMPNKKKSELNLWSNVSSGFSSVGAKVEWRIKGITPIALIIRFTASENPDDSTKTTSYLVVSKITKTSACITDIIKPGANQNADAQLLADAATGKPCKKFE
jgi:hypothetical protein